MATEDLTPESLFEGHPDAWAVYARVRDVVAGIGPCEVRASKSQVAFRRARGFAYVWRPGHTSRRRTRPPC